MKVSFRASELFTVEAEGSTHAELFENLATLSETYSVQKCGCCGGSDIIPIKRKVDDDVHYEMKCNKCNARLTISKKKTGELYPRRRYHPKQGVVKAGKAKEGDYVPNNGWEKWSNERNDDGAE